MPNSKKFLDRKELKCQYLNKKRKRNCELAELTKIWGKSCSWGQWEQIEEQTTEEIALCPFYLQGVTSLEIRVSIIAIAKWLEFDDFLLNVNIWTFILIDRHNVNTELSPFWYCNSLHTCTYVLDMLLTCL